MCAVVSVCQMSSPVSNSLWEKQGTAVHRQPGSVTHDPLGSNVLAHIRDWSSAPCRLRQEQSLSHIHTQKSPLMSAHSRQHSCKQNHKPLDETGNAGPRFANLSLFLFDPALVCKAQWVWSALGTCAGWTLLRAARRGPERIVAALIWGSRPLLRPA